MQKLEFMAAVQLVPPAVLEGEEMVCAFPMLYGSFPAQKFIADKFFVELNWGTGGSDSIAQSVFEHSTCSIGGG